MDMTTDTAGQRAGSLTVTRPTRQAPALIVREIVTGQPVAGIEIDVLGVAGVDLDATLERIRARLERYANVVGREIVLAPVGHPDAPSGYLATGVIRSEVEHALGCSGPYSPISVTAISVEGRW